MNGRALRWLLSLAAGRWSPRSGPPRLTIVRHHRVYADGERALYHLGVSESVLRAQVETCARDGAVPCTVREGLARLARGDAGHAVAFSFDDGYADNVTRALPVLERFGAKATFYLAAGLMETRTAPWWDELVFVIEHAPTEVVRAQIGELDAWTWPNSPQGRRDALRRLLPLMRVPPAEQRKRLDDLRASSAVEAPAPCELAEWPLARRLAEAGMELGAHTMTHPFLTLQFLTDGTYEPEAGLFLTPSGHSKCFVASDDVESPLYRTFTHDDLFDIAMRHRLHFDPSRQTGIDSCPGSRDPIPGCTPTSAICPHRLRRT